MVARPDAPAFTAEAVRFRSIEFNRLGIFGGVAQLGERRVRNAKVEGSIPFSSTNRKAGDISVPASNMPR